MNRKQEPKRTPLLQQHTPKNCRFIMTDVQAPANTAAPNLPEKDADAIKLFVGQLPKTYSEEEVRSLLQTYGTIHDLMILKNKFNNESKGQFWVYFS